MENNIVTVNGLDVVFKGFYAVRRVSFDVRVGEIFGFLGANGAGKTTTIRVLCGLLTPSSGEVFIDNEKLIKGNEDIVKQKVGYMSQKFTLYEDLTVEENLSFAASIRGISKAKYKERKEYLFDFIKFEQNQNVIVSELPNGIKQEVALVASMLHDPKLIFLDEPTAGVAPVARQRFWDLIKKLAISGKTVFVTTHYMDEAENCDRIALMRSGELIALDSPENLKKSAYKDQMYKITARDEQGALKLKSISREYFYLFEPYGRHFHAVISRNFDERKVIGEIMQYCDVKKINPSLEDVFVKLVEGISR